MTAREGQVDVPADGRGVAAGVDLARQTVEQDGDLVVGEDFQDSERAVLLVQGGRVVADDTDGLVDVLARDPVERVAALRCGVRRRCAGVGRALLEDPRRIGVAGPVPSADTMPLRVGFDLIGTDET
ncbi:hypothetical protein [Cellulomonas iranensis]|uniref:hypothetical protein n=1 Tax=Cellulomonas iranensis TaxID=76862 RepID=UPI003D7D0D51